MSVLSFTFELNTIIDPSGDHAGAAAGSTNTVSLDPATSLTARLPPWTNAIFEPSGDQAGSESEAPLVSCVSSDASGLLTQSCPPAAKTIWFRAHDQEGEKALKSELVGSVVVSGSALVPSASTTTSS